MTDDRKASARARRGRGLRSVKRVKTLKSLKQVKVLADALRVRILEGYRGEARTTKQLAKLLGEKPSKLYHHVEALEKAGLIKLEKTRQNRGTLEKYYLPVADLFQADPKLFSSGEGGEPSAMEELVTMAFDGAADELLGLVRQGGADELEKRGIVARLHVRGSAKRMEEIQQQLEALLTIETDESEDDGECDDEETWGGLIAFYPLPRSE